MDGCYLLHRVALKEAACVFGAAEVCDYWLACEGEGESCGVGSARDESECWPNYGFECGA